MSIDNRHSSSRDPAPEPFEFPPRPAPHAALALLHEAAIEQSGGSQAVRSLLFWMAGEPDPTGYAASGGLELRRLDAKRRQAALDVLNWWAFPEDSTPLFEAVEDLRRRIAARGESIANNPGTER